MLNALKQHWPEYLMEATELALFMISVCGFGVLLEYTGSPVRQAISDPFFAARADGAGDGFDGNRHCVIDGATCQVA